MADRSLGFDVFLRAAHRTLGERGRLTLADAVPPSLADIAGAR